MSKTRFRSRMFEVGDIVEPNFLSTRDYGIGVIIAVHDDILEPKLLVQWACKDYPLPEHFSDITRVKDE